MGEGCCGGHDHGKRKGILARFFEKLDKKLEEKSKNSGGCCESSAEKPAKGDSCCS